MKTAAASSPKYEVKSVETIVAGSDVHARLYTLAPGDIIPWHFHSEVADWYFCLAGRLTIETRVPDARRIIEVGDRFAIAPHTAHQISNAGSSDCCMLLLQGVGRYDFQPA